MKKFISILTILLAFSSQAQKIKFGAKVGLNATKGILEGYSINNNRNYDIDTELDYGYLIGGTVNIELSDKFSFNPELLYKLKSVKSNYIDGKVSYSHYTIEKMKIKTSFLDIPLKINYKITKNLNVHVGPELSILLEGRSNSTSEDYYNGEIENVRDYNIKINEQLDKLNFNLGIGASYTITKNIYASANYTLGLNNQFKSKQVNEDTGQEFEDQRVYKINNLQFSMGYWF